MQSLRPKDRKSRQPGPAEPDSEQISLAGASKAPRHNVIGNIGGGKIHRIGGTAELICCLVGKERRQKGGCLASNP
jgi:hypothetical protein